MKTRILVICLFATLSLTACKTNPAVTETVQNPAHSEQNSVEQAEAEEDDRGFDPCLLNSSLAVCNKQ